MIEKGKSGEHINNDLAKKIMLDILVGFDAYCKKHNLKYFLGYGTLLGAIRHKGYIPWDNDIDVVMLRKDYNRLRELLLNEPISRTVASLDYRYIKTFPFLKIFDNRTILKEKFLITEDMLGLYIDVFPLDEITDNKYLISRLQKRSKVLYKLFAMSCYRFGTGRNFFMKCIKIILYPLSKLINQNKVCEKLDSLYLQNLENKENKKVLINLVWGLPDNRDIYKQEWYEDTLCCKFEGHSLSVPKDFDLVLKQQYGDYMVLPPEESRYIHEYDVMWK